MFSLLWYFMGTTMQNTPFDNITNMFKGTSLYNTFHYEYIRIQYSDKLVLSREGKKNQFSSECFFHTRVKG